MMAYSRRPRKRRFKKRRFKKRRRPSFKAQWAYKTLKRTQEHKELVASSIGDSFSIGLPLIISINTLAEGSNRDERVGDKVYFNSLLSRACFQKDNDELSATVRMMVVQDKQNNGTLAGLGAVVHNVNNILSGLNIAQGARFKVLMDKFIDLQTDNVQKTVNTFRKLKIVTRYSGATAIVNNIVTNNIFAIFWSDSPDSDPVVMTYFFRLRYLDS